MSRLLDLEAARSKAQLSACEILGRLYSGAPADVLEAKYVEAEHCWMFFRNRSIYIPPEQALRTFAYVVSKRGGGRLVPDYWDDPIGMAEYLERISDYLATHDA